MFLTTRHSSTISIRSSVTNYRHENGRRYHAYQEGEYWGPNDEGASDHLNIGHHLYTLVLNGDLFLAPIGPTPKRVLDVGTGTGIWAIDFADQFEDSEVIGVDLSPIQPTNVPFNVRFEIDDMAQTWTYPKNHFSFVHIRGLYGSIRDWPAFYKDAYDVLEPGGWIEQAEISVAPLSDDGSVTEDHIFARWGNLSLEAGERFGKSLTIHKDAKGLLRNAGFEEVTEKVYKLPIGGWSNDPRLKEIGKWNQLYWEYGIEAWSLALMTRVLGWSYNEVQVYLAQMRKGLKDCDTHAYHFFNVVYARKPNLASQA
ncbi:S-adenosyl-L-methionine-dependent methyltransferase [Leptodontidium sp. MPI-SDFR-AT-0119]|nr:S-adenosyl-L-methionine-dependent methyltransferase [Leptodontidium sp. MPI-SDFR-AT-0119]